MVRMMGPLGILLAGLFFMFGCDAARDESNVKVSSSNSTDSDPKATVSWLAGDHHVHRRFSVTYEKDSDPPAPVLGGGDVARSL
jgi:hypothetical protein